MKNEKLSINRYPVYKDSGVEWLGNVPEHWKITHLKRISQKITDGAHTSPDLSSQDYPFLTVVNLAQGVLDFENCLFTSRADYEKLVRNGCQPRKNDVLYSKDGTISETVLIDKDRNFVVGSSFIIIRPRQKSSDSKYLCYLLGSFIMKFQARLYIKGAGLTRISISNIAKLILVLPPLSEQKAIAHYLDTKTAQIDRKIDLLTQKAALYGNLKQSLINETVTRGLDKSVPMKNSGVEWIGEIPKHWSIYHLKNIVSAKITDGPHETPVFTDNGVPFISAEAIQNGSVNFGSKRGYISKETDKIYSLKCKPRKNDIFIVKSGSTTGKIGYVATDVNFNIWSPLALVRASKINYSRYLFYFLSSSFFQKQVQMYWSFGTQPNIGMKVLENLQAVAPRLSEQKAIAHYLDTKTAQIDQIIQTINTQIEKLRELRKTLINDVVTGKLKVTDDF